MKKIALIEDRYKRQLDFLEQNKIELDAYEDVLSNFVEDDAQNLIEQIVHNTFDLQEYAIIICHKSVEYEDKNTIILSNLRNYCKKHSKTLVLFSGGISVNHYDNSEFELLELNSKTFYSQNLVLFLEAVKAENKDIMMLCYGEHWKQNIVANVLEKTNLIIFDVLNGIEQPSGFQVDVNLKKIEHLFYEPKEKTFDEIIRFKESLEEYFNLHVAANNPNQSVIIHHDNVCDLQIFNNHIKFTQSSDDIDKYISDNIIKELVSKEFDTIFIKDNLSSNYLELYGLRVAYHIRLSTELGSKRFTPIVIISDFDEATLNRFTHEANILFTEGIYLCKNTKEDIQKHQSLELKGVSNYDEFLSSIEVTPPKDTSGSHDIANKWSIYRWANFLGAEGDAITKNRNEVENELYIKYLKALHVKQNNKVKEIVKPTKKGKILLIDDEWSKGWGDILKSALSFEGLEFDVFEYDFKDKTNFNLIVQLNHKELKRQITESDVVILDLRLLESDHENDDLENYTGIKLLQKIHEINAGIQVIMLTATSKSTILEKLYEKKILGYIKKEHPEDKSIDTVENINKFVGLIDKGLERKYLKEIWSAQQNILNYDLPKDILIEISTVFEILDSNMENKFNFTVLTFSKIFEYINKLYINENDMKYIDNNSSVRVYNSRNNTLSNYDGEPWYKNTQNRLHNILYEKLDIVDEKTHRYICEIINCRNYIAHPNEKRPVGCNLVKNPNETNIIPWFELVETILNKI